MDSMIREPIERLKKVRGQIWYLEDSDRDAASWREYAERIEYRLLQFASRLEQFAALKKSRAADACQAKAAWIRLSIQLA